jgi:hypothetical protein
VAGTKSTISDRDTLHRLRTAQLNQVIPVADITIFNQNVLSTKINAIGIG